MGSVTRVLNRFGRGTSEPQLVDHLSYTPIRDQRNRTLDRRATSSCKRAVEQNSLLKSKSRMIGTAYANKRAELAVCSIREQNSPIRDQNSLLKSESRTVFLYQKAQQSAQIREQNSLLQPESTTVYSDLRAEQSSQTREHKSLLRTESRTVFLNQRA